MRGIQWNMFLIFTLQIMAQRKRTATKKADESKSDSDYKALGKYMFKCINIQDEREPEYVKGPNSSN